MSRTCPSQPEGRKILLKGSPNGVTPKPITWKAVFKQKIKLCETLISYTEYGNEGLLEFSA